METEFRKANQKESELLAKLLNTEFVGVDALRKQIPGLLVRTIDKEGSLELKVNNSVEPANVLYRTPVSAYYNGKAGSTSESLLGDSEIILHVINGYLNELEFVYYSNEKPRMPSPEELIVITLPAE
jgi:hypothetical protein